MFLDIINGAILMVFLAGVLYGGRWVYLAGWKDGRATIKAEMQLEEVEARLAALRAS